MRPASRTPARVVPVVFSLLVVLAVDASAGLPPGPNPKCPVPVPVVNDRCPAWASVYDNANGHARFGTDRLSKLVVSPQGDKVYVAGSSWDDGSASNDVLIAAYDAKTGEQVWIDRYNAPDSGTELVTGLTVSADGSGVFLTGVQSYVVNGGGDALTIAYTSAGVRRWISTYQQPDGYAVIPAGIDVSDDGSRLYVGGVSVSGSLPNGALVLALSMETGAQEWLLWHAREDVVENVTALAAGDGDRIYLVGYTRPIDNFLSRDYFAIAVHDDREANEGVVDWTAAYDGNSGSAIDIANAVALSPDGETVVVTGSSERSSGGAADFATVALAADSGERRWVTRYGGNVDANYTSGNAVAFSPSGTRVFVTGQAGNLIDRHSGYGTVAYDAATGGQVWARVRNGPADYYSIPHAIAVSPDGRRVYVTGEDGRANLRDTVTVAHEASTGDVAWTGRYNDAYVADWAMGLAMGIAPDGKRLFVGAMSLHKASTEGANGADFLTLAYDTA